MTKLSRTLVVSLAIGVLLVPSAWAGPAEHERTEADGWFDRVVETVLSIMGLASDGGPTTSGGTPAPPSAADGEEGDTGPMIDPHG